MYPEEEEAPSYVVRPNTAVVMDLLSNDPELDDELALEEADAFTQKHPITPATFTNPAFQHVNSTTVHYQRCFRATAAR